MTTDTHTPGPWRIMPCPEHVGKHPLHDRRWITTADAELDRGSGPDSWGLSRGSLICEMRDGPVGNAALIAAAPALLASLKHLADFADLGEVDLEADEQRALEDARRLIAALEAAR